MRKDLKETDDTSLFKTKLKDQFLKEHNWYPLTVCLEISVGQEQITADLCLNFQTISYLCSVSLIQD